MNGQEPPLEVASDVMSAEVDRSSIPRRSAWKIEVSDGENEGRKADGSRRYSLRVGCIMDIVRCFCSAGAAG